MGKLVEYSGSEDSREAGRRKKEVGREQFRTGSALFASSTRVREDHSVIVNNEGSNKREYALGTWTIKEDYLLDDCRAVVVLEVWFMQRHLDAV